MTPVHRARHSNHARAAHHARRVTHQRATHGVYRANVARVAHHAHAAHRAHHCPAGSFRARGCRILRYRAATVRERR